MCGKKVTLMRFIIIPLLFLNPSLASRNSFNQKELTSPVRTNNLRGAYGFRKRTTARRSSKDKKKSITIFALAITTLAIIMLEVRPHTPLLLPRNISANNLESIDWLSISADNLEPIDPRVDIYTGNTLHYGARERHIKIAKTEWKNPEKRKELYKEALKYEEHGIARVLTQYKEHNLKQEWNKLHLQARVSLVAAVAIEYQKLEEDYEEEMKKMGEAKRRYGNIQTAMKVFKFTNTGISIAGFQTKVTTKKSVECLVCCKERPLKTFVACPRGNHDSGMGCINCVAKLRRQKTKQGGEEKKTYRCPCCRFDTSDVENAVLAAYQLITTKEGRSALKEKGIEV